MSLSFAQVQHAWQVQDPSLVDKLYQLATQQDYRPDTPIPESELTFERFLGKIFNYSFRQQPDEVQFAKRIAMIATLEADEGFYPLPSRYKIHLILIALWEDNSAYSRAVLKQAIQALPLSYGVWKGLKRIYKAAEFVQDYEIFGQIAAKIDLYRFNHSSTSKDDIPVSVATKTYMSLRAWRYLRTLGQQLPIGYIDAAVEVLASYDAVMTVGSPEQTKSWVLNHICFHNSLDYGVNRFSSRAPRKLFNAKGRAFSDAWQRDSDPLIRLLAIADNEAIRQFATDSLKHDFKIQLRDVSPETIQYLSAGYSRSQARDEMIVWLLESAPHLEKSKFQVIGLHQVVLKLLHSDYSAAYNYAIGYAKSYAQNIPVTELMLLAICDHEPVRAFAIHNILSRDPVNDIGIRGWGQLLDTDYHYKIAAQQLTKHFTRRELTPDWFFERLTCGNQHSVDFAISRLPELYSAKELGADYFINITKQLDVVDGYAGYYDDTDARCMIFALNEFRRLDFKQVDAAVWQCLLLHPLAKHAIIQWIDGDSINMQALNISYWHALAYEPDWQVSDYIQHLKTQPLNASDATTKHWQKDLMFDEDLAYIVRTWLADVRRFAPIDLGFDWLMKLAHSGQSVYREFAIGRINKGFLPADFVAFFDNNNGKQENTITESATENTVDPTTIVDVDLAEQRFLFTGKMQSMTRRDAEKLVKAANGAISGAVNNKLNYLVIGDDGSPLYGNGRKGSKQLKAEDLIALGASLKIISETAFLQMLSGQAREVSVDDTFAGAKALWQMATADPSAPISELAISYLSHHHEQICMALTDRPVDPNAIIPSEFFSAERVIPLLTSHHNQLREFGLLLSEYELAHWQPTPELWLTMAESTHSKVTQLLKRALLNKPTVANRRYHVRAEQLNIAMLDAFINSEKREARQIGITLLQRYSKFQNVRSLYVLTQSTDREVRYAAVTMLWQHYKARQISPNWQPLMSTKIDKNAATDVDNHGSIETLDTIKQQPSDLMNNLPAETEQLLLLLRRGLFEVPPGRFGNSQDQQASVKGIKGSSNANQSNTRAKTSSTTANVSIEIRAISASKAKLALIETFRDVGLADQGFAALIMPTLYTFTHSAGKMERHECLVAVTRLLHRYPELSAQLHSA